MGIQSFNLGGLRIGHNEPCCVVADIGAMYENIDGMKALIKVVKDSGADAVKIQTYRAETIALPDAEFEFEDGTKMSQYDFFKQYEISEENHYKLFAYAADLGIPIFSTPSSYDDADFLESLDVPVFKTGSDDLTNHPFLEYLAKKGKPMIVSTGMSTLKEVEDAVRVIIRAGNNRIVLLHCTVSYPARPEHANLRAIQSLREAFGLPVGYSDHVPGILSSVLAVNMGACLIEKHLTFDRSRKKPDYHVSLEPSELKELLRQIRKVPLLRGSAVKKVCPSEEKWRRNARKSLVAARDIKIGEILQKEDFKIVRPGTGIHPKYIKDLAGKRAPGPVRKNQIIPKDFIG